MRSPVPVPSLPGDSAGPRRRGLALLLAGLAALGGCSPALDWRSVRPADGAVAVWMPCKPDRHERPVQLAAGLKVTLQMQVCDAGGTTWAVSSFEVAESAAVDAALEALRAARPAQLGGSEREARAYTPAGAAPRAQAQRILVEGRRPDGRPVRELSAAFAVDRQVYQLLALDGQPGPEALDMFFERLELARP